MTKVQRYTWEDALIEAEATGIVKAGAVNTGLRLARNINWEPKDHRPSGLYWDNETAAEVVSISRASLYRNIKELKAAGFFVEVGGNLQPVIPQSQDETKKAYMALVEETVQRSKSHNETSQSQNETSQSHNETQQSQNDNPYSEDTYTEDVFPEEVFSETVSDEPVILLPSNKEDAQPSLVLTQAKPSLVSNNEEGPQSHYETVISKFTKGFSKREVADFFDNRNKKHMTHAEAREAVIAKRGEEEW